MVLLLLFGVYLIRKTLLAFVIALMLAYLLFPLVDALHRRLGWRTRIPAVAFPFIVICGLLAIFGVSVRNQVRNEARQLVGQVKDPNFKQHLIAWTPVGIQVGKMIVDNYSAAQIVNFMPELTKSMRAITRDLSNLFIVPILSFFFLKDGRRMCDSLVEVWLGADRGPHISPEKRRAVESVLNDAHLLILEYMRALLFLCLATLISFTIALRLMHVPYAILLALVAFPLEFVPLVGPLTSALVIVGVCEFNQSPQLHLAWVVIFLALYRLFQDYLLSPHLMNKGVKLHPLLVMFGVLAGGELGGLGGVFLSVPLLALGRLVYYEWHKRRMISLPLGSADGDDAPSMGRAVSVVLGK